jgi:hypothetical protein
VRLKSISETEMHRPAKPALIALACILVAGLPDATADDLLDLGTRDLARMKTVGGITLAFDPGKITMVYALPRPGSPRGNASIANVVGLRGAPQEIDETVDGLLERLDLKPYFIALTLPDGVRVWLKASIVSFIRAIESWDHTRPEAKSAVNAGGRPIFVKESMTTIEDAINATRRRNRAQ